jgi:hypothetical protein
VLKPSGEVYDRDCVRWYSNDPNRMTAYYNIGDGFVYDSSLKLLDFRHHDVCKIRTPTPKDVERYNAEFDYVLLRGSNYLHSEMDWERAEEVLSSLRIPILAFGVGAQAPAKGKLEIPPAGRRIWELIADRCTSIGVRGTYSAEVLWDMGIRNTKIIGCPTAFRNNDPDLRITLPPLDSVRKIGFTLRREVSPLYSPDVRLYLNRMRDIVKRLSHSHDIELMAQGEVEEKKILFGTPEQQAEGWASLRENKWLSDWFLDDEIEELYRTRLFFSDKVADYESLVRGKDLVLGYRLHGNLMALANGVPSIYFLYDSRTSEFRDTFQIPSYDVYSEEEFSLERYWDQELFEKFNRAYHARYRDMRDFLDENGIPHRMKRERRVVPSRPASRAA